MRAWLITGILLIIFSTPVFASVSLNEILPDPSDDNDASEWIEIYNSSDTPLSLEGWKIQDAVPKAYFFKDTVLTPHGFYVLPKATSLISLNNTSETISLYNNEGVLIDSFTYTKTTTDTSYARIPDGIGPWSETTTTTKGTVNVPPATETPPLSTITPTSTLMPSPSPTQLEIDIELSEVYACPSENEEEWIEVVNRGSTILLDSWFFQDKVLSVKPLHGTMQSGAHVAFSFYSSWLNNDGDSITLFNGVGEKIAEMSYASCQPQKSWIKTTTGWAETTTITKDAVNIQSFPSPTTTQTESHPSPTTTPVLLTTITVKPTLTVLPTHLLLNEYNLSSESSSLKIAGLTVESASTPSQILGIKSSQGSTGKNAIYIIIGGLLCLGAGLLPFLKK